MSEQPIRHDAPEPEPPADELGVDPDFGLASGSEFDAESDEESGPPHQPLP